MNLPSLATACLLALASPALAADTAWDHVRSELFGDRVLLSGDDLIGIDAPHRTYEDARTDLAARITAPKGTELTRVTLVLDENPMPVSAVFDLDAPQRDFFFDVTMRINGPTPIHVIAETNDGRAFVSGQMVKTSGQGACAAPPGTDRLEALATLGQMQIEMGGTLPGGSGAALAGLVGGLDRLDLAISHPSHSGMQKDQISLLFIPVRYVEAVDIDVDGQDYLTLTGSISLSENPRISVSMPRASSRVAVTMTDTDGTVATEHASRAAY